jgi:cobalamin biosynthesis protein CobD/CbiB
MSVLPSNKRPNEQRIGLVGLQLAFIVSGLLAFCAAAVLISPRLYGLVAAVLLMIAAAILITTIVFNAWANYLRRDDLRRAREEGAQSFWAYLRDRHSTGD